MAQWGQDEREKPRVARSAIRPTKGSIQLLAYPGPRAGADKAIRNINFRLMH